MVEQPKINPVFKMLADILPGILLCLAGVVATQLNLGHDSSLPYEFILLQPGDANLTLDQIAKLPDQSWERSTGEAGVRTNSKAYDAWFRVKPSVGGVEPLAIGVASVLMSEVDFYSLDSMTGVTQHLLSGSNPKGWTRSFEPSHVFNEINSASVEIYAKVKSPAHLRIPFFVSPLKAYLKRVSDRDVFLGTIFGGMIFLLVGLTLVYSRLKLSIYRELIIFQTIIIAFTMLLSGMFYEVTSGTFLGQQLIQIFAAEFILAANLFIYLASFRLFEWMKDQKSLVRRSRKLVAAFLFSMASVPFLSVNVLLPLILASGIICAAEVLLFYRWHYGNRFNQDFLTVANSALAFGFIVSVATLTGHFPSRIFNEFMYAIGALWSVALLSTEIVRRLMALEQQKQAIINNLQSKGKIATRTEGRQNEELVHVTIMFIDIVSFSLLSERMQPDLMFKALSERFQMLTKIIVENGGSIDRSLGDGLLCFFANGEEHHASRAFRAARIIQETILKEGLGKRKKEISRIYLPVRIGIHSDHVLIENLGGRFQIDFTLIGRGVTFASQLEQACSPFKIMLSTETAELLRADHNDEVLIADGVYLGIKHHDTLSQAFEFDPFTKKQEELSVVKRLYSSQFDTSIRDHRYQVRAEANVELRSPYGTLRVSDFSLIGFKADADVHFGQNTIIEVILLTHDRYIDQMLEDKMLTHLTLEVRWSRRTAHGFEHGLRILGSNKEQGHYRLAMMMPMTNSLNSQLLSA